MKKSANRMLLLGLLLHFLSQNVMCKRISAANLIPRPLKPMIDGGFDEVMKCSPNTMDEIKNCVTQFWRKENTEIEDCTYLKHFGNCQRAGMLTCENGPKVWKVTALALNKYAISIGCSKIYKIRPKGKNNNHTDEEEESSHFDMTRVLVGGILLVITDIYLGILMHRLSVLNKAD